MNNINYSLITKINHYRRTGTKGMAIHMHRSLRKIDMSAATVFAIIVFPVFFEVMLWISKGNILYVWQSIFTFWQSKLGLIGTVPFLNIDFLNSSIAMPYPALLATVPSLWAIYLNMVASVIMIALSFLIPHRYMPVSYLLRAALFIQLSSSMYFLVGTGSAPYDLNTYISGILSISFYFLFLFPLFLAFVYYIFNFPLWKKFIVTTIILSYFIIAMPVQYMLHAVIMSQVSMLFMPILYIIFGILLNMLMLIGWYSWAMTWEKKIA